jgi:hypothetical protein
MRIDPSLPVGVGVLVIAFLCAIVHPHLFTHWISHVQWRVAVFVLMVGAIFSGTAAKAQTVTLLSAAGGATLAGGTNAYTSNFGNMNALGVNGANGRGLTPIVLSNGALYYTPIRIHTAGLTAGRTGTLTAYVSAPFAHGAAVTMQACPYNVACTSSAQYSTLSTSAVAQSSLGPAGIANNSNLTAGLAIFVPDNNGPSAWAGTNTVTVTFTLVRSGGGTDTCTLAITLVSQTAVQLTLSTASGGATINSASDYSLAFGNVNALGIGPGAGFTTIPVAGGMIYYTPILLNPAFAEFTALTASITAYVSTDFAHPSILSLQGAAAGAGPYAALSKNAGAQTQVTTTAADRSSTTGYLGLFISNVNGATAFNGADSATLTFTLTVP